MKTSQKLYLPFKRIIGLFGSFVGIFVCSALLWWWIIIVNTIATQGHPFFVQERYGKNQKVFKIIKFRTMKIDANPNLAPSEMGDEDKKDMDTKFGRFLRKTSLDETAQLFNIFVGQMAFIGPRPGSTHNEEYLRECRLKYTPNAFDVKPGLGGYAQIMMKRGHNPDQKAQFDHYYASNISFRLDFIIFVKTFFKVFGDLKGK